jgi:hypothetical protein
MGKLCIFDVVETEFEILFESFSRFSWLSEGDTKLSIWT